MSDDTDAQPLDEQVEEITHEAQKLDDTKRRVMKELSDRGEDVGGARIIVAHRLGGLMRHRRRRRTGIAPSPTTDCPRWNTSSGGRLTSRHDHIEA
ncbi:hypothetical protein [Streptomyces sp. CA-251251]|uniref:hypothetical protein n=1 Tax=Streptomyces sp. CA-251251 TaxID=3240063 RepID=UPI003D947257